MLLFINAYYSILIIIEIKVLEMKSLLLQMKSIKSKLSVSLVEKSQSHLFGLQR